MLKRAAMVIIILGIIVAALPLVIYWKARFQGLAAYVGILASFLTPFFAIVFISTRTKDNDLKKISDSLDAYACRGTEDPRDRNLLAADAIDHGARFEIYSHYLGLSTQIVTGLAGMLLICVFMKERVYPVLGIGVYLMVAGTATWVGANKLSPWSLYREAPVSWYNGKYYLPPLKAPLNWLRLGLFGFGIISICILGNG